MSLLSIVIQNVLRYFPDTFRVQQGLPVFRCRQFCLVLLGFNRFELRAHIVVVHLELEHLLIANGVGDHIGMQFTAKHAGGGFCTQSVLGENGGTGKAELIEPLELLLKVFLGFTKLAAVALIKNKHDLPGVNWQVVFALHQVIELLNGGDDDLVIFFVQIALQPCGAVRAVDAIGGEPLVLLHGLVVQIFPVHHKEYLVDNVQLGGQSCCFEAGQRLAGACGMPDIAPAFWLAPVLARMGAFYFPQDTFGRGNLVRAHYQQGVADIENRVFQQHFQQSVSLKEGGGEVFQILDQAVVSLCPMHGEVKVVLVPLGGVSKVAGISTIGNHKQLQILEQGMLAVEALFAVAMYLVKGLANGYTASFQFHLHHGQSIDQNGDIVAIGMAPSLLKLLDDL